LEDLFVAVGVDRIVGVFIRVLSDVRQRRATHLLRVKARLHVAVDVLFLFYLPFGENLPPLQRHPVVSLPCGVAGCIQELEGRNASSVQPPGESLNSLVKEDVFPLS
jgi:hypothetical protein